ncbi:MAG TPA: hypothetical protein VHG69_12720 [Thermoleophilaceae bacterium]|nr:hypothetical protein [Thermoleophilaceae bacterium]
MSVPAVSLAFFDRERQLYGSARSGASVLFKGVTATALPEGPEVQGDGEGFQAELPGVFSLRLQPISEPAELGFVAARVCRVAGEVGGAKVDCLGTVAEAREVPSWDQLDALRSLTLLADETHALLAVARRPRGALGHGDELVVARLLQEGELLAIEEARISTVYDGEGRQRSAGLELWLPGEDFPRRGSGTAVAGSSLELEGLRVHVAVFDWRLEGREAMGAYELTVRSEAPTAA